MKITTPIIPNEYSCMLCYKEFESQQELSVFWFCEKTCEFQFAFRIVNKVFPKVNSVKKFALANKICEVSLR